MRLGILIIGSLYWDRSRVRCRWRQARLSCTGEHRVRVPIRYGKKSSSRGNTFTMVFAKSCSEHTKLGIGIVVPTRAECCEPGHLLEEAEHLWAAERNVDEISGICLDWGKVCILKNPGAKPAESILQAWQTRIAAVGNAYTALPTAKGEDPVLDAATGLALFDWPIDDVTNKPLLGFDLLLMTVTEPTLKDGQYPTAKEIADAWRADGSDNVLYFHNNRHYGIRTFEDDQIRAILRGEPPNPALQPTAPVTTKRRG